MDLQVALQLENRLHAIACRLSGCAPAAAGELNQAENSFDLEALLLEMPKRLGHGLCGQEEIQVLGVAPYAGMVLQSEGSGDDIRQL